MRALYPEIEAAIESLERLGPPPPPSLPAPDRTPPAAPPVTAPPRAPTLPSGRRPPPFGLKALTSPAFPPPPPGPAARRSFGPAPTPPPIPLPIPAPDLSFREPIARPVPQHAPAPPPPLPPPLPQHAPALPPPLPPPLPQYAPAPTPHLPPPLPQHAPPPPLLPAVHEPPPQVSAARPLIALRGVRRVYDRRGGDRIVVLDDLALDVPRGAFVALMGPSGSGKSTLLNIIAGLDRPTAGVVEIGDVRVDRLTERELPAWRARHVGFVFQSYNLIGVMTALENVMLPLLLVTVPSRERKRRALTALRVVGLDDRASHYPAQLSGGQQQRVAIARAIVHDPDVIIADEPTGDLDRKAADEILLVLDRLAREFEKTIVMVTHDPLAAARAFVTHRLDKGNMRRG